MTDRALGRELEALLREQGASVVGFADLAPVPAEAREGMPYGVSIGVSLTPSIVTGIAEGPTEDYAREYVRVNGVLGGIAKAGAAFLEGKGHRAVARQATLEGLPGDLITPLPQKTVATLAGLGWIGKCALLITPGLGPAVRLNSILTDAPLPPATPVTESKCGDCTVCVDICPAHAPSGKPWKRGMQRSDFFDAFACRDACHRIGQERGISKLVCGKCIAHCPFTRRRAAPSAR